MKIGIMTFWETENNYGQLLQIFALQAYLKNLGHEAFLIKYRRISKKPSPTISTKLKKILHPLEFIKERKVRKMAKQERIHNYRDFESFRNGYLYLSNQVYDSLDELKENPPEADMYICGSDQVWNNSFPVSCEAFLLDFGDKSTKRIAYSASFGKKKISEESEKLFKRHLSNFDAISVREFSGINICDNLGYKNTQWLPDPTMLFTKEEWLVFFKEKWQKPVKNKKKQLFLYTLGNSPISDRKKYIRYINRNRDLEVFHVSANSDYSGKATPTVPEWVNRMSNSDIVITNSFHGMVFSIIFNKEFIIFPNTGNAAGMNERITSLLRPLKMEDRIMFNYNKEKLEQLIYSNSIDWLKVNGTIAEWKQLSDDFFDNLEITRKILGS